MKKHLLTAIAVTAAIATIAVLAPSQHIGPANLYPNPTLTQGVISTQDFATLTVTNPTYSQAHRNTSQSLKNEVRAEYPTCPQNAEIDHLVPLALGGADVKGNLWCQPAINQWNGMNYGFHEKDRLEAYLVLQMKAGNITPKDAQGCIITDWVRCYQQNVNAKSSYGSVGNSVDPDDE